jgi:PAS domain S-box-containing protein
VLQSNLHRFFVSIVILSVLAISLFILSIFIVVLPAFEKTIMEGKKEMISELTNSVISLIDEYQEEAAINLLPEDSARALAAKRISRIRYGDELKDYFWIIDEQPRMIMHPYRPELIDQELNNYKDPNGKLLFVESVQAVSETGEGFIDYMWQWKDDDTRIVPKLSYVKEYQPWGWIVGTGIYLEDVRIEIGILKSRLLKIAILISLILSAILAFIIRQSLRIENRRKQAEKDLHLSKEKYKSLVEASTEGTLMLAEGVFIFSNLRFSDLSGYDPTEVRNLNFNELFRLKWESLAEEFTDPKKSISRETILLCKDGITKEVVISASRILYAEQTGYIIVVKEVSNLMQVEIETELLTGELQTSLQLMNQPLRTFARKIRKCPADTPIKEAALLMTRKNRKELFISQGDQVIGMINNNDLKSRVLAADLNPEQKVLEIMTSPLVTLPEDALLYEGLLLMKQRSISHLVLAGPDHKIKGVVGMEDMGEMQLNMVGFLIREIESAEEVEQIAHHYRRLPLLARALIESGSNTRNLNRIITSVADAIHQRLIELALEELGPAPCKFAFMVMGSLGRMEQTLATDQDNALILELNPACGSELAESYFQDFSEKVNRDLNQVGYHYCPGEIMANNPKWNKDLQSWKGYFTRWIQDSNPQDVLDTSIFFDFRYVYGERAFVDELREHVNQTSDNKTMFFYHMAQTIVKMKLPKSDFRSGELSLDLKEMLLPVISYIRLSSIRKSLYETNTTKRVERLHENKVFDKDTYEELKLSFNFLTHLRIKTQARNIAQNELPGNSIQVNQLNRIDIVVLKKLIADIAGLQSRLSSLFSGPQ